MPESTIRLFILRTQPVFVNVKDLLIPEFIGVKGFNGPGAPSLNVDTQFQFPTRTGVEIFDFLAAYRYCNCKKKYCQLFFH